MLLKTQMEALQVSANYPFLHYNDTNMIHIMANSENTSSKMIVQGGMVHLLKLHYLWSNYKLANFSIVDLSFFMSGF